MLKIKSEVVITSVADAEDSGKVSDSAGRGKVVRRNWVISCWQ